MNDQENQKGSGEAPLDSGSNESSSVLIHAPKGDEKSVSLREAARLAVSGEVTTNIEKRHTRNHHRLYVRRNGSLYWGEEACASDELINRGAATFAPLPSIVLVGTGSIRCDCDWCADGGTVDVTEVDGSEMDAVEAWMLDAFDVIPVGYFDDEEAAHA